MKIFNNPNVNKVMGAYQSKMAKSEKTNKTNVAKDKIEISTQARDFQFAINEFKKLPDVRQEKVDEISKSIASGNYNPSSEEVVDKITTGINFNQKI